MRVQRFDYLCPVVKRSFKTPRVAPMPAHLKGASLPVQARPQERRRRRCEQRRRGAGGAGQTPNEGRLGDGSLVVRPRTPSHRKPHKTRSARAAARRGRLTSCLTWRPLPIWLRALEKKAELYEKMASGAVPVDYEAGPKTPPPRAAATRHSLILSPVAPAAGLRLRSELDGTGVCVRAIHHRQAPPSFPPGLQDEKVQVDFEAKRWARHQDRDAPIQRAWDDAGTSGVPDLLGVSRKAPDKGTPGAERWGPVRRFGEPDLTERKGRLLLAFCAGDGGHDVGRHAEGAGAAAMGGGGGCAAATGVTPREIDGASARVR